MSYVFLVTMFLTAFIALELALYILSNRKKVYLKGFLGLILGIFIYSLFYFFELIAFDIKLMKLCAAIQYIGILSIPAFWIVMALEYTNKSKYLNKKFYIGLFIVPIVLIFLNFTNDFHHLFYKHYAVSIEYALSIANIEPGIGYIIGEIYINSCFIVATILYIKHSTKGNNVYKKRTLIILITSFIPWMGYWLYMSKILWIKLDIVPIFLELFCVICAYTVLKSNIFETVAIARHIVFDSMEEMLFVLDRDNNLIDINKKAEKLLAKKASFMLGQNIYEVFSDFKKIMEYIEENRESTFELKIEIKEKTFYFKGKITYIDCKGNEGKIISLSDNTEQVLMIEELRYYATMDILTEVYNRNYFYTIANEKIVHCLQNKQPLCLVMMDLDKFKNINDTYGHTAGDLVLKNVLTVCKIVLGEETIIGRYGGEEFVILLENVEEELALQRIEEVRIEIMNLDTMYENKYIKVTCSFGIFISKDLIDLDCMIRCADEALYKAKNMGRNRVSINKN